MEIALKEIEAGSIMLPGGMCRIADIAWSPHPKFPGVSIRNLIAGQDSQGGFSVHLVNVEPGAEIGEHCHDHQVELHQVLVGAGKCLISGQCLDYSPGEMAMMPAKELHRIIAGDQGLVLQAVFSPPLI